jgi:hypothetical protein
MTCEIVPIMDEDSSISSISSHEENGVDPEIVELSEKWGMSVHEILDLFESWEDTTDVNAPWNSLDVPEEYPYNSYGWGIGDVKTGLACEGIFVSEEFDIKPNRYLDDNYEYDDGPLHKPPTPPRVSEELFEKKQKEKID